MKKIRNLMALSSLILLAVCGYSAQIYAQSGVSTDINYGINYFDVTLKNHMVETAEVVLGIVDQDNLTHQLDPVTVPPNDETNVRVLWDFTNLGMPTVQILSGGTASIDGSNNAFKPCLPIEKMDSFWDSFLSAPIIDKKDPWGSTPGSGNLNGTTVCFAQLLRKELICLAIA